jgi:hypothetical protein
MTTCASSSACSPGEERSSSGVVAGEHDRQRARFHVTQHPPLMREGRQQLLDGAGEATALGEAFHSGSSASAG